MVTASRCCTSSREKCGRRTSTRRRTTPSSSPRRGRRRSSTGRTTPCSRGRRDLYLDPLGGAAHEERAHPDQRDDEPPDGHRLPLASLIRRGTLSPSSALGWPPPRTSVRGMHSGRPCPPTVVLPGGERRPRREGRRPSALGRCRPSREWRARAAALAP